MDDSSTNPWKHSHTFGQDQFQQAEKSILFIIFITTITMFFEISSGILLGSMALLADGLHMGSHSLALGISAFAYYYTRKHASDSRFCFGTGKVNSLGGFSSAILLLMFAFLMLWESIARFISPVEIRFNQAIFVAIIGLIVNVVSVVILGRPQNDKVHQNNLHHPHRHHSDHNLKAAYLHVFADALTSLFAIFALLAGKFLGLVWIDPLMGIIGAIMVSRWAWRLIKDTSQILLDKQAPHEIVAKLKDAIESKSTAKIADLHVWAIGPNIYAANLSIICNVKKPPKYYKNLLKSNHGLVHVTVEIQHL